MVVLAVESRDHVKGVLTWAIAVMHACDCERSTLEMGLLEMLGIWEPLLGGGRFC